MPSRKKANSPSRLPRPIESVLRAVLLNQDAAIPVTPAEVAAFDARHKDAPPPPIHPPHPPSPLFSWEKKEALPTVDQVVGFPQPSAGDTLAFAARKGLAVTPETRAKLSRLIQEMKEDGKKPHA